MNRKFLMAQLNHELYKKGKTAEANWAADEATIAYDSLQTLMYQYNHQLDGKWNHMMDLAPGWCAKYQNMPKLNVTEGVHPKECKDALVNSEKSALEGCAVLNLADYKHKSADEIRLLNGVGYDWQCVQLGEPTTKAFQPQDPEAPYIDYEFSFDKYCPDTVKAAGERGQTSSHDLPSGSRLDEAKSKEIEVTVYSLPFFPIYKGRSTRYGVSVDNSSPQIAECLPKEYGEEWKDNVLRNGAVFKGKYIVDLTEKTHKLRLSLIDPGMIIERIIIDWGGLKASYIGPSAPDSKITR